MYSTILEKVKAIRGDKGIFDDLGKNLEERMQEGEKVRKALSSIEDETQR